MISMSRRQLASAVGADENWVINTARMLDIRLEYRAEEAVYLRLVRTLTREFGLKVRVAASLAARALAGNAPGTGVTLAAAEHDGLRLVIDLDRFHATADAAVASALAFEGRKRAGRKPPRRRSGPALAHAADKEVGLGFMRLALSRPVPRRLLASGYVEGYGPPALLERLSGAGVRFVVAGELAEVAHGADPLAPARAGASRLVVCYDSSDDNVERLVEVLRGAGGRIRQERRLPRWGPQPIDRATIRSVPRLPVETPLGALDLSHELRGIGLFHDAVASSIELEMVGGAQRVVTLSGLIDMRHATGQLGDAERLVELEALAAIPERGRPIGCRRRRPFETRAPGPG